MAYRSVEAFNVSILRWLPRLNIQQGNLLVVRLINQGLRNVLRAIVATNRLRLSPPFNDLL